MLVFIAVLIGGLVHLHTIRSFDALFGAFAPPCGGDADCHAKFPGRCYDDPTTPYLEEPYCVGSANTDTVEATHDHRKVDHSMRIER